MSDFKVLILDDDELWLARHRLRLEQASLSCRATQSAQEAIKIAKTDPTIKFALIDEILYVTPIPIVEDERELQHWQGKGVIREITAQRSDLQIVVVTGAPKLRSGDDLHLFRRETAKLRRQRGVIDIVHKVDIDDDPDGTYKWLVELLKTPQIPQKAEIITPKVLIGLGFTKAEHEAIAEQIGVTRRQYLPISPLLKQGDCAKLLDIFWQKAREKVVLFEMPGSKKLDRLTAIKPDSSAFKILAFLAQQAEKQAEILIKEHHYQHHSRKVKRLLDQPLPDYDERSKQDYAFSYGENGRRQLRAGVQIEGASDHASPLKVAVHRLSRQLEKLNIGTARNLFLHENGGYRPKFELGIMLYAVKETSMQKSTHR